MRHIESTESVTPGMVILTGSYFYLVTDVFPSKFRGHVWLLDEQEWGPIRDVPLPSPCHPAHEVEDAFTGNLFPSPNKES